MTKSQQYSSLLFFRLCAVFTASERDNTTVAFICGESMGWPRTIESKPPKSCNFHILLREPSLTKLGKNVESLWANKVEVRAAYKSLMPKNEIEKATLKQSFRHRRSMSTLGIVPISSFLSCWFSRKSIPPIVYAIVSVAIGISFEHRFPSKSGLGILMTMTTAAVLSNTGVAPSSHAFYDKCWSIFLPTSLALLLLSPTSSPSLNVSETNSRAALGQKTVNEEEAGGSIHDLTGQKIVAVGIAFIVACLGSVVGCSFSFFLSSFVLEKHCPFTSLFITNRTDAAMMAGCLLSSYIGGTFNFYNSAFILNDMLRRKSSTLAVPATSSASSLFSAMAGADLLLMAIYFATLAGMKSSSRLWSLLPGRSLMFPKTADAQSAHKQLEDILDGQVELKDYRFSTQMEGRRPAVGTVYACSMTFLIVQASNRVEKSLQLPGLACALIAILSSCAAMSHKRFLSRPFVFTLGQVTKPLSSLCFHFLFAAIGFSANISQTILQFGPASVLFAGTALIVHVAFVLLASLVLMKILPNLRYFPLGLDEVMVASNAAIGGPATAAAFAGTFDCKISGNSLALAATVWGVFGYAIGTGFGVALTKWLLRFT